MTTILKFLKPFSLKFTKDPPSQSPASKQNVFFEKKTLSWKPKQSFKSSFRRSLVYTHLKQQPQST